MTERTTSLREGTGIELPASLFQQFGDQYSSIGIFFGLYETATLFPTGGTTSNSESRTTEIYSQVLAATVGHNLTIQNLESPVTISLKPQNLEGKVRSTLFILMDENTNIIVSHNSLVHRSFFEKMCLMEF